MMLQLTFKCLKAKKGTGEDMYVHVARQIIHKSTQMLQNINNL